MADEDIEADTESESETDDEADATAEDETTSTSVEKDGTAWNKNPLAISKPGARNIPRLQRRGPHRNTKPLSFSDTFKRIFTDEMIDMMVCHTNKKATTKYQEWNANNPEKAFEWKPVTFQEMYSFLGVLIGAGANNSNADHTTEMWKLFTYPLYRFWSILRFIRFDDSRQMYERR